MLTNARWQWCRRSPSAVTAEVTLIGERSGTRIEVACVYGDDPAGASARSGSSSPTPRARRHCSPVGRRSRVRIRGRTPRPGSPSGTSNASTSAPSTPVRYCSKWSPTARTAFRPPDDLEAGGFWSSTPEVPRLVTPVGRQMRWIAAGNLLLGSQFRVGASLGSGRRPLADTRIGVYAACRPDGRCRRRGRAPLRVARR